MLTELAVGEARRHRRPSSANGSPGTDGVEAILETA
jgi:hypothetical protein